MIIEIITISISVIILFSIYFARSTSSNGNTFLFSNAFLNKADELIFDFIKFIFKLHSLLFGNISIFLSKIPHKIIKIVHGVSHRTARYTSDLIEKITHKNNK